jgi:hypothetical protein
MKLGIVVWFSSGEIARHVPTGGEAPDADGVGAQVPVGGVGADETDGALTIREWCGIEVAGAEAIL